MPKRGERSVELTPGVSTSVISTALNREVNAVPLCSDGLKLDAWSKRNAPWTVSRSRVHVSGSKRAVTFVRSAVWKAGSRYVN